MPDLLFFLFIGHFCGDYAFQSDRIAAEKGNSKTALTTHVLIYTLTITTALITGLYLNDHSSLFSYMTPITIAIIFSTHWLQDYIKSEKFNGSKQAYYMDQAIHILILFIIRILIYGG